MVIFRTLVFFPVMIAVLAAGVLVLPGHATIMNNDEFGSIEIIDFSVIEQAANIFSPIGLNFNVSRGGPLRPGDGVTIYYRGQHGRYASLLDFSPDRFVRPLVINDQTRLNDGGLEREYYGTVDEPYGMEYVMLIISALPLTDPQLEDIALAPNEVELDDNILSISVNNFEVVPYGRDPDMLVDENSGINRGNQFIPLEDFAIYLDYPLNTYPYNPWRYMYLYPYARIRPTVYIQDYGIFSKVYYFIPSGSTPANNFWNYATTGWIDNGILIIPPGGYWQGTLNINDPYTSYFLRVLPLLIRQNDSYMRMQVEINGTLVQSSIDITRAIGWGQYWTTNPFNYYNIASLLHQGDNNVRIYWPEDEQENLELQMIDAVPSEVATEEIENAETAAQAELGTGNGDTPGQ